MGLYIWLNINVPLLMLQCLDHSEPCRVSAHALMLFLLTVFQAPAKLLGAAGEVIEDGASIVFPLTEGLPRNTNPEEDTISSV